MTEPLDFLDSRRHDFVRVAVAVPRNRVADPVFNAAETVRLFREAADRGAALVAFPELGLAGYTCDDLFHQHALLDACLRALQSVVDASATISAVGIVGLPLRVDNRLFNCAAVVAGGRVLGVVPKTYLPNYGEFYEARQFQPASTALATEIELLGATVPFGALLFRAASQPLLTLHIEICEDLWVPIPPSSFAALAGATVLVNLSASNITVGKSAYRHALVANQASRCLAAYLYASAGIGESTTDLAWDGQALVSEMGDLVAESKRFLTESHLIVADVDLERLAHERMRQTSFGQSAARHRTEANGFRRIVYALPPAVTAHSDRTLKLERRIERFPYVPSDRSQRDSRCGEVYDIQVQALLQRVAATGMRKLVIGISGGLDSTHALLVCARAMDLLGQPRSHILAYTMPGFATSGRTLEQARALMTAIGCSAGEIDIRPSCLQMLADIGHPYASGSPQYDLTFENVQAGERTSHLFRLANLHGGLVVGTGDLSELALGWCTYGVGDHMAHYNVNASVPKTLIQHLVRWVAETGSVGAAAGGASLPAVLDAVLATAVSPELVPTSASGETGSDQPGQSTEDQIGPYELHDFFLYYIVRFGYAPSKVAYLAHAAWSDAHAGAWPDEPGGARHAYALGDIKRHLRTFLTRFFLNQFKRSCVPNAPKVGSGGSLSPRGDWRAPSDAEAAVWLADVERIPDA